MTTSVIEKTASEITRELIARARSPRICPEPGCRAWFDAALSGACEYHASQSAPERPTKPCAFSRCKTLTPNLDLFGLCPEHSFKNHKPVQHALPTPQPRGTPALMPVAPTKITPHEYDRVREMMKGLTREQKTKLTHTPPTYPRGREWRGAERLPSYLAGLASAVARGHYTITTEGN